MDSEADLTRKKRGAQAGNTNAVKHGLYSRCFRRDELEGLGQLTAADLQGEIAMLRALIRRLFELATSETPDLEVLIKLLTAVGRETIHVSRLLRDEKALTVERSDVAAALSKAISGVLAEMER